MSSPPESLTFSAAQATGAVEPSRVEMCRIASLAALQNAGQVRECLARRGFDRFVWFQQQSTRGFAAGNRSLILVAMHGDLSEHELRTLAREPPRLVETSLGRVGEEFWRRLALVRENLQETVAALADAGQSVVLTGHGVGGALAVLAGAVLASDGQQRVNRIATFGAPRPGSREFAARCQQDLAGVIVRAASAGDLLTLVPGREFDFAHVGEVEYFDGLGRLRTDAAWLSIDEERATRARILGAHPAWDADAAELEYLRLSAASESEPRSAAGAHV
ncbi:MAG: hypothetical protein KF774_21500 [Planctomyces sp.]|nr:hypothetical protein [Planctomyces sp.]